MFVDMLCPTLFIACGWTAVPPNGTAARPYRPEMKSGEEERAERRASRACSTAARATWMALGLGAERGLRAVQGRDGACGPA